MSDKMLGKGLLTPKNNILLAGLALFYFSQAPNFSKSHSRSVDRSDIFDLSGKIIQSLQVSDQHVNVRALPNGSYWVKAYSSGKVYQTKMVKM